MLDVFQEEKEGQGSWSMVNSGPGGAEAQELGGANRTPNLVEHDGEISLL